MGHDVLRRCALPVSGFGGASSCHVIKRARKPKKKRKENPLMRNSHHVNGAQSECSRGGRAQAAAKTSSLLLLFHLCSDPALGAQVMNHSASQHLAVRRHLPFYRYLFPAHGGKYHLKKKRRKLPGLEIFNV